jgi:hypothetical protein
VPWKKQLVFLVDSRTTLSLNLFSHKLTIQDLSAHLEKQLVSRLKRRFSFSLHLYESPDVSRPAVLLVFVCCLFENKIKEI